MGTCGSRLQKQPRELKATTDEARRRRGSSGTRWKEWSKQHSTRSGNNSSTPTTTPPVCRRCTNSAAAAASGKTPTSSSPKPFGAPCAALGNGLGGLPIPDEILRSSVFSFLGSVCLTRAGGVCRSWGAVSVDEHLWKALCLKRWVCKHVALLEDDRHDDHQQQEHPEQQPEEVSAPSASSPAVAESAGEEENRRRRRQQERRRQALERAGRLRGGLEELVAAMPIKVMKRRLEELGANPGRLATCLEKDECVSLMLGSMLLSREGLLREKGQIPPWASRLRGWRWSYYFADKDARRCWLTMDDIARTRWMMSFPGHMPLSTPPPPLPTVACEFHRDFSYTDEGFHQDGLGWHFEDSQRCVKVSHYPALEAERDASWGWRLVNPHVIFEQQRAQP